MKEFYKKHKEIINYLIFGVLTTIVGFVTYKLTTVALIDISSMHTAEGEASDLLIIIAQIVQWVCAVAFAFVVNKKFVFEDKDNSRKGVLKQLGTFAGSRVITWFLETGITLGGTKLFRYFGWFSGVGNAEGNFVEKVFNYVFSDDFIAKCIAAVVVVITNYFISKLLVFKKKADSGDNNEGKNPDEINK